MDAQLTGLVCAPLSFTLATVEIVKMIVELDPCRALNRVPVSTWKSLGHSFIENRENSILGARCYSIFHRVIEFAGSNLISEAFIKTGTFKSMLEVMAATKTTPPPKGSPDVRPFKEGRNNCSCELIYQSNLYRSTIRSIQFRASTYCQFRDVQIDMFMITFYA